MSEVRRFAAAGLEAAARGRRRGLVIAAIDETGQEMLLKARDWPSIGQEITGVVISYSHDGRLVVSARPSDIALVRSATDIQAAMDAWVRLCRADEEYVKAKDSLIASNYMETVLRWALSRSKISLEPGVALRALANAPSGCC